MLKALALAAVLLAAPAALAQPAQSPPSSPPPAGAPGGGAAMTPAMQTAREQVRSQCAADFAKFCPDAQGPARMSCMREHAADMSDGCKGAMQSLMAARSAGG